MRHCTGKGLARIGLALAALAVLGADASRGRKAVEPVAPTLPGEVVAAIQEARFADAIRDLDRVAADPRAKPDEKAYLSLVGGTIRRLAGRLDEARATLSAAVGAAPKGPWAAKLRAELAAVEVAAGRFDRAEALARAEAEALLDVDRKDRLADVFRAFARRLLRPETPSAPADPEGAHALLAQGRNLARGDALRADLLLEMARASQAARNPGRAVGEFQSYLAEYPKGADRFAARYDLGEVQMTLGQGSVAARLTWIDLARDLEKVDTRDAQALRARALYGIARTFGMPAPADDASLNLGVAALKRLAEAYPEHPLAVRGSYEIGAAYLNRGKSQEAFRALTAFLEADGKGDGAEARKVRAELVMTAQFQVGQVLQGQEKFDEAIAAWRAYVARFPNGPQSADAQRAVLDTRLMIAADLLRRERYAEARKAWQAFAAENPLDARVPGVLFQAGESFVPEKKYDDAVAAWEALAAKFPGTEPAAHGLFLAASLYENEKGEPESAVERFKKVAVEPWQAQARQRVAVMEAKALTVVTPRAFRSGEAAHLRIGTRNLEKLTFTAYKLSPEAYFRKKHALGGVESLDIGLVAPDAEWTAPVPGYAKYRPIEVDYVLDRKVDLPGVYVVKVTDEKTLQATTLVLGSDLDAVVKASREQVLVFAQDMKTGQGRAGARVLVAEGGAVILDERTGKDGVLLKTWDRPREGHPLSYLVLDGRDAAGTGLGELDRVAQGLSPRAYLYTDRPAYRPGQIVGLRGVVREVSGGQYASIPGAVYRLEVTDARGRLFVARPVKLSDFGTFHESVALDEGSPVGTYQVRVYQPGKSEFPGAFEVQAYKLEKVDLEFDLPRTVYFRGETVKGRVVARYQYGTPLAGRPLQLALPDGRTLAVATDAAGAFAFEFETAGFAEEQALRLTASLPGENVAVAASVNLAVRAFTIEAATTRDVYLDGESFRVEATTRDVQGQPTGHKLSAALLKRVTRAGRVTEKEVERVDLATDSKTGQGGVSLKADDPDGGPYVVRVSGTDRFGNAVVADRVLTISGKADETRLRILADRQDVKVGEEATVRLHSRGSGGSALLTWEADRILRYKVVALKEGENPLTWAVDDAQFPNFTLNAARMVGTRFDRASLDLKVGRDLDVTVRPLKGVVGPGEEVEAEVTTRDQLGRPVAAEVSLALVDRALLRLFNDTLPPIGPFFHGQTRTGAFATGSTNTFRYQPASAPVPEAVVEEDEREAAEKAEVEKLGSVRMNLRREVDRKPAPAPMGRNRLSAPDPGLDRLFSESTGASYAKKRTATPQRQAGAKGGGRLEDLGIPAGEQFQEFKKDAEAKVGTPPRQSFVETAYWNPAVVTGKDGTARVRFRAPTALSQYRFTARGVTGSDTLAGQSTADLAVRKDVFVDLKLPATLTEGDRPRLTARLHHAGVKGKATLTLKGYPGDLADMKTFDVAADGSDEVTFEPFLVPDADTVRLELTATLGGATDTLAAEVPIRPWGVQAFASASGASSNDATAFVALPAGRSYADEEMVIVLSPTVRRMLVELAVGRDAYALERLTDARIMPPPPVTTADRAGDLIAAGAVLTYLRGIKADRSPEYVRLTDRLRGLVAELITTQNDDGGWAWVGGRPAQRPSDRLTSARVTFSLRSAWEQGWMADPRTVEKAVAYLQQELAGIDAADHETRAAVVHALSAHGRATFEQANGLNRVRQGMSSAGLSYLALTFANLDRAALASEVLGVLGPRSKTEAAEPGTPARRYWEGQGQHPWHRSDAETTALAALAYARVSPRSDELRGAADWLTAHRQGAGWQPAKARGPALAALAAYHGQARAAEDAYRLVVTVNGQEVERLDVHGASEGRVVRVPRAALKRGVWNRVGFDIEGRGTFGYAITLTGFTRDFAPDQDRHDRRFTVDRRVYGAPGPTLEGKPLPTGFGVALNAQVFENTATQLPVGVRTSVTVEATRHEAVGRPAWERDFLVLEEHLPAGTTLVEGSVRSAASHHTFADGVLTLYFAPDQQPGCVYDVFGYLPGDYRALPPSLSSAYEPGRRHLGSAGGLKVLPGGEKSTDPYRPTPDELYARGKGLFDSGRRAEAAAPLEALWTAYTLRDDVAREAARMLLVVNIEQDRPRQVVQYFEVLREKAPGLVIPFDQIRAVGRSYAAIGEHERAYLVWRATTEASYLEDARVGEVLRQRGLTLEGVAFLLDLWREYPGTAPINADFFAVSQIVAGLAGRSMTDRALRRELAAAGVARSELLLQSVRLTHVFLALSPTNPLADEASLGLVGSFLDLEDYEAVVRTSRRFAALYPKSTFLDSFQYSEALGRFHLGEYDRAIEVAEAIAAATRKDANGVEQPSPNRWQALYILGQIYDARSRPARAVAYYRRVSDRFGDAADAVRDMTRKELTLPEVSVVRPARPPKAAVAANVPLRETPFLDVGRGRDDGEPRPAFPERVELGYRNIAEVDLKVYPVDLMRLYLTRRSLDGIAGIDLAGVTPKYETRVKLGDGADFRDRLKALDLPLDKDGAYLVMARGDDLYASGVALVSPLEVEVREEPTAGRVRVTVRDARTRDPLPRVQVKVTGSGNRRFFGGETDLRGVFAAEGVVGQVTAVARRGEGQYAFYRGKSAVGSTPTTTPAPIATPRPLGGESLEKNVRSQNSFNQDRQLERLKERYGRPEGAPQGVQVEGVR